MSYVEINGDALAELLSSPSGEVALTLQRRAPAGGPGAKRLCPVDTGRLRSSITNDRPRDGEGLVAVVGNERGTPLHQAGHVEDGRSRSSPRWRQPSDHFVDGAATFAPLTAPLRATDCAGSSPPTSAPTATAPPGYAGGTLPTPSTSTTAPPFRFSHRGGLDGGTAMDRPFARFSVWALAASDAGRAPALRVLDHAREGTPSARTPPSQVRLAEPTPPP